MRVRRGKGGSIDAHRQVLDGGVAVEVLPRTGLEESRQPGAQCFGRGRVEAVGDSVGVRPHGVVAEADGAVEVE